MSRPTRFAIASAIAATVGAGGLAWLFGAPWAQIAAFMFFTALLGGLCVVLLVNARVYPRAEASSSGDDTIITATIATDIASSTPDKGGHGGGHGV
jgi:hypothetical protein